MYTTLYRYFIQHNNLNVPGIGTFLLHKEPATIDFPNKKMMPPVYKISLIGSRGEALAPATSHKPFYSWIAAILRITDREAVMRFNDFAFDIKKQIEAGNTVQWQGVGTLSKGLGGEIKFIPFRSEIILQDPVAAEKIIRENAQHSVRVGEEHKTSAQMTEMLAAQPVTKRSTWWAWSLIAGLLVVMFLGWYFSQHGVDVSSTANHKKLSPAVSAETYRELKDIPDSMGKSPNKE
jgi:hypothetical protein